MNTNCECVLNNYVCNGKHKNGLYFYRQIQSHEPVMPREFSPEAKDLITRLLKKDPSSRLGGGVRGALDIKNHPFFHVSFFHIYYHTIMHINVSVLNCILFT